MSNSMFFSDAANAPEDTPERRIARATDIAFMYAQIDGAHHKMWTIDQMVRALTGAVVETAVLPSIDGNSDYVYKYQDVSLEYEAFIARYRGEATLEEGWDEPSYEYEWDEGSAP